MKLSRFNKRSGGVVLLTKHQEIALERAGVWGALNYTFVSEEEGKAPTFTDAEIATQLVGYRGRTHIGRFHPGYINPNMEFLVMNPVLYCPSAACAGFADALNCARTLYQCDIASVLAADFRPDFYALAEQWRVTILVV